MKQCYSRLPIFLALFALIFYLPRSAQAQCLCSDGTPAVTAEHVVLSNFSSNSTKIINIPQFDPATGTLICVNAKVFLTSIVRMDLENDEDSAINYLVNYIRTDTFYGPGINPPVTGSANKVYGPFPLAPSDGATDVGPDHVFIGPDTVYNKKLYEATTADVSGYLGSGSVNFFYKSVVNTFPEGSDFYGLNVSSLNRMEFRITYSYCNLEVLPLNIMNFNAALNDDQNVALSWNIQNETKNNTYEIELSENGTQFRRIATAQNQSADGAATKYQHQYHLDQPLNGKLYFRIKQNNGNKSRFSEIKAVNAGQGGVSGLRIFPNPAIRDVRLEFNAPVTGDYVIELVSQMGQVVHVQRLKAVNNRIVQLVLNTPPPAGLYYLRVKSDGSQKQYSGKLIIQN